MKLSYYRGRTRSSPPYPFSFSTSHLDSFGSLPRSSGPFSAHKGVSGHLVLLAWLRAIFLSVMPPTRAGFPGLTDSSHSYAVSYFSIHPRMTE